MVTSAHLFGRVCGFNSESVATGGIRWISSQGFRVQPRIIADGHGWVSCADFSAQPGERKVPLDFSGDDNSGCSFYCPVTSLPNNLRHSIKRKDLAFCMRRCRLISFPHRFLKLAIGNWKWHPGSRPVVSRNVPSSYATMRHRSRTGCSAGDQSGASVPTILSPARLPRTCARPWR
jgi:hypothetical protein